MNDLSAKAREHLTDMRKDYEENGWTCLMTADQLRCYKGDQIAEHETEDYIFRQGVTSRPIPSYITERFPEGEALFSKSCFEIMAMNIKKEWNEIASCIKNSMRRIS